MNTHKKNFFPIAPSAWKRSAVALLCMVLIGLTSCTKQSCCKDLDNYTEGTLVILKEPYYNAQYHETYCARFFPKDGVYNSDFEGMDILGGLPNKYKKMDTVQVGIGYTYKPYPTFRIPAYTIKCIEQIDNFKK